MHHRCVPPDFARALRASDDADDRGMTERKSERRFRQPDLETLADVLDSADPFLHLVRRPPIVIVGVGLDSRRQYAGVERAADDNGDFLFLA